jgi:protein-tyrosine-phosphatase
MAAGFLRERLAQEGLDTRHRIISAGTWAVDGYPASEYAIATMAERGIDITDHIAHTITANDVAEADLILVMSQEHQRVIRNTWPQYAWKMLRLSEIVGKRKDVPDPYGGSMWQYRACAETLSDYIDHGFERILALI